MINNRQVELEDIQRKLDLRDNSNEWYYEFISMLLDHWASPQALMPDIDLFDTLVKDINWEPSDFIKNIWEENGLGI